MKPLLLTLLLAAANAGARDFVCPTPPGDNVLIEGYVASPGLYPVLTLSDAIARAGGFLPGSSHMVYILRRDEGGIAHTIPVSLKRPGATITLRAGDIVQVDRLGSRIRGCLRPGPQ